MIINRLYKTSAMTELMSHSGCFVRKTLNQNSPTIWLIKTSKIAKGVTYFNRNT